MYLIICTNFSFKLLTARNVKMVFLDVKINTSSSSDRYQHSERTYCPSMLKIKLQAFPELWYASTRLNCTASQKLITCSHQIPSIIELGFCKLWFNAVNSSTILNNKIIMNWNNK
jgi:hypothetical protein